MDIRCEMLSMLPQGVNKVSDILLKMVRGVVVVGGGGR
jgi:hypothetical protein